MENMIHLLMMYEKEMFLVLGKLIPINFNYLSLL